MTPVLALVESNTTGTGRDFCAAAAHRGLLPVVLARDPGRYPYIACDGVEALRIDTSDDQALRAAAERLGHVAGVTSSSEYAIPAAARLAAALGLPSPQSQAVRRCRNKAAQLTLLRGAGVPVPAGRAVGDVQEAVEVAGRLGHPVVLKPASGSGSVGVRRCDDAAQVEACATELFAAGPGEVVLVQQHVVGDEYSVEAFDGRVVGITRKHVTDTGEFVETGHDFPAVLPPDVRSALVTTTERALRVLDVAWGATHTELRLGPAGATIIEVNPRLAGGMIPRLVHHALGIDLVGGVVERAVGHPVDLVPRRHGGAAIRFLVADRSGVLDRIAGLEAVAGLPGVVDVGELVAGRRRVDREGSFRDRLAYVVTAAATTPRAAELGDEAVSLLSATWEGIT